MIFVHSIGEQRRFEHLDGQLRPMLDAIARRNAKSAQPLPTIEIIGGQASTLHADQDTWSVQSGAPVRAVFNDNGTRKELFFHEVWWADVNERYSLAKQINFWLWGLSVWANPSKPASQLSGTEAMAVPSFGSWTLRDELVMRTKLFGTSNVFLMAAFSIGAAIFFAKRLFGFEAPNIVRVFVNYISSVKLYSQRRRSDGGFLDAYQEPPRVSIRRRMIRTIADVALNDYNRWYIFAHSLGSVVAFNGVMENAHALPNYLDSQRWNALTAGIKVNNKQQTFAGKGRPDKDVVGEVENMMPARPAWLEPDDVVYRDQLFGKFRGLFTYGSPLDKFAAIWPARVPINVREAAFQTAAAGAAAPGAEWINAYDPTDPVSASIDAFSNAKDAVPGSVLQPRNFGYAAHPMLLYSHLCYLRGKRDRSDRLVDRAVEWVLGGQPFAEPSSADPGWFAAASGQARWRRVVAWVTWIMVYVALAFLGALTVPLWQSLFVDAGGALAKAIGSVWADTFGWTGAHSAFFTKVAEFASWLMTPFYYVLVWCWGWVVDAYNCWIAAWSHLKFFTSAYFTLPTLVWTMLEFCVAVALITLGVGFLVWLLRFQRDWDDSRPPPSAHAKALVQALRQNVSAALDTRPK